MKNLWFTLRTLIETDTTKWYGMMLGTEFGRIWKEMFIDSFKIISRKFFGEAEGKEGKVQDIVCFGRGCTGYV